MIHYSLLSWNQCGNVNLDLIGWFCCFQNVWLDLKGVRCFRHQNETLLFESKYQKMVFQMCQSVLHSSIWDSLWISSLKTIKLFIMQIECIGFGHPNTYLQSSHQLKRSVHSPLNACNQKVRRVLWYHFSLDNFQLILQASSVISGFLNDKIKNLKIFHILFDMHILGTFSNKKPLRFVF